ncbi:EAL domain-containing protein [Pontibacillus yanchengensis]|uniref:EAL domain-containing protein n=2 Tax=Pontibacillus yanchengensis TaxID=462910 RepID=A0ACC7VCZ3_9BACI|nr:EAL domain-containing protein [Pontibacillus yanchengensis]MYL35163.1 EAL domain-containing protein [Pontibacillus yanchengensis]MYL52470.1 EAL domain-containing protein [Pontibacillus yanchengensis]
MGKQAMIQKTLPLLFIVLGYILSSFHVSLFLGVDFLFGSIVTVIVICVYGWKYGLLAGFISSLYTIILWGHPYAVIIFTVEAFFLGFLYEKRNYKNIVLLDGAYWLLIGAWVTLCLYHFVLDMSWIATILVTLKLMLNGVFNTLLASILVDITPFKRWVTRNNSKILLENVLFYSVLSLFLIPIIILVTNQGQREFEKTEDEIKENLSEARKNVKISLETFIDYHLNPIKALALNDSVQKLSPTEQLQQNLKQTVESFPNFHNVYVADENSEVFGFYPPKNKQDDSTLLLNFSDREYFKQLKETNDIVVSEVFVGRGGITTPTVTINYPIHNKGRFQGHVTGALNLEYVNRLLKNEQQDKHFQLSLIDKNQHLIASTSSERKVLSKFNEPANAVEQKEEETISLYKPDQENMAAMNRWKQSFYRSEVKLEAVPWTIIVDAPVRSYQQDLYNVYVKIFLLSVIITYIIIMFSYLLSHNLFKPIRYLGDIATEVQRRIVNRNKIEVGFPVSQFQELDVLSRNLQKMSEELAASFNHVYITQEKLNYMAYHDKLTGLANRDLLAERLKKELDQNVFGAILFLDLDRFKLINDTFGHDKGDELLIQVSNRLKQVCPEDSLIGRQGGDEFIILLSKVNKEQAFDIASSIVDKISDFYMINNQQLTITTSLGVSVYPEDSQDINELIKYADISMYKAKELGKNRVEVFDCSYLMQNQRRVILEKELRFALEKQELFLHYQPKINIQENKVEGVEALIRWRHDELGEVSPGEFIPIAEETGLIIPIGEWVIEEACKLLASWKGTNQETRTLSINISIKQLLNEHVLEKLQESIHSYHITPSQLEVEVTESKALEQAELVISKLKIIRNMGIRVSLDDFGTGYSSLSYLKDLPIDVLKIDRSFINELHTQYGRSVVQSIIDVAHSLQMSVVAEGIEEHEQLYTLIKGGCDSVQGFLFAKPMSMEAFLEYEANLEQELETIIEQANH